VRDLLSDEDQKYLVKFRSTRAVVAQMGQLIAHLRAKLSIDSTGTDQPSTHSIGLEKLDQLSKDLAALAREQPN
jgi:hypothetical protein